MRLRKLNISSRRVRLSLLVSALLVVGAAIGLLVEFASNRKAERVAEKLVGAPSFRHVSDTRLDENKTIEVRAEVEGERTGGYTFNLYVINYRDQVTYSHIEPVNIGAFPYAFTHRIHAETLSTALREQHGLKEVRFCEPVMIGIGLVADGVDIEDYSKTFVWRANVDICNFENSFIPPQDVPVDENAEGEAAQ